MVLPLFFHATDSVPLPGDVVELIGAEAKHAVQVRRMRVGEGIQLANGRGLRIVGTVAEIAGATLLVRVGSAVLEAASRPALTLVQALAKGDRDELAIQAATELGCNAVVPWQADRSVSRWDAAKAAKGVDRWQTIVNEAAKQALRSWFPTVGAPMTTRQIASSVAGYSRVLVLDPTADLALSAAPLPEDGTIAIVVGPEGGISDVELQVLEAAGATRVRLGTEILRTSTAGLAAISAIQAGLGRW